MDVSWYECYFEYSRAVFLIFPSNPRSLKKSSVTWLTKTKKARNSFASVPPATWVCIYNNIRLDSLNKELNWIFLLRVWFIFWQPLCAVGIGALAVLVPGLLLGFLGGGFFPAGTTTDFFQVSGPFTASAIFLFAQIIAVVRFNNFQTAILVAAKLNTNFWQIFFAGCVLTCCSYQAFGIVFAALGYLNYISESKYNDWEAFWNSIRLFLSSTLHPIFLLPLLTLLSLLEWPEVPKKEITTVVGGVFGLLALWNLMVLFWGYEIGFMIFFNFPINAGFAFFHAKQLHLI